MINIIDDEINNAETAKKTYFIKISSLGSRNIPYGTARKAAVKDIIYIIDSLILDSTGIVSLSFSV